MMLGPGRVLAGLHDKRTLIGELDGSVTPRITRISDAFNRAGLTTAISTNIMGVVWDKLLVNAATGALSGITRLPYGALYSMPEVRACALAAVSEGIAVAEASGVSISIQDPAEAWNMAGAGLPYEFKPSILQSLEKGSRTEIDFKRRPRAPGRSVRRRNPRQCNTRRRDQGHRVRHHVGQSSLEIQPTVHLRDAQGVRSACPRSPLQST